MKGGTAVEVSISLHNWDGKDLQWQFDCTWFAYSDKSYIDFSATSARSDYEKKYTLTTVYLQGYQSGNVLGIQYWFYYPFHDDPAGEFHPHDWWYFWIWYNTNTHRPEGVVYDFHHNLRAQSFTDGGRVVREGIHVKTCHDAGGHRVLWDSGEWPSSGVLILLWAGWKLADVFEGSWLTSRDVIPDDKIFGTMLAYLKHENERAPWRDTNKEWDVGVTLRVEYFPHWVWVYGVEEDKGNDSLGQPVDLVKFTETGTPFYNPPYNVNKPRDGKEYWPSWACYGGYWLKTPLPWKSNVSWAPNQVGSKAISSTEMVWKWKDYLFTKIWNSTLNKWIYYYDWTPVSPCIGTRYFDGSP